MEQGLFWLNFPITKKNKNPHYLNDFLQLKQDNLFLNSNPSFLFTGTNNFTFDVFNHDKDLIKKILTKNKEISIYLYEPAGYYKINQRKSYGYYEEFHNQIPISNIRIDELDSINNLKKIFPQLNVKVYTTDYNINLLQENYPELNLYTYDVYLRQVAIPHGYKCKRKIEKRFFCSNGRYTPHRHLVMAYLANKEGIYSWRYLTTPNWKKLSWLEKNIDINFLNENNNLLNSENFYIDSNSKKINVSNIFNNYFVEYNHEQPRVFRDAFQKTFCYIISETRFAQPTGNISEKTTYAFDTLSPFVLVAPPYSLEYVKRLGFRTFHEFWDESYDYEENHSIRLGKIFSVIDYINSIPYKGLRKMYKRMENILMHNFLRFQIFKNNKQVF